MASSWFTDYSERKAETKGSAPDPVPRSSAAPGKGRVGADWHPKLPGVRRRIHQILGRRVKTSMIEDY